MAKDSSKKNKKRLVKPAPTVREQSAHLAQAAPKARRIRRTVGGMGSVFAIIGRFIAMLLSPFSFLLWPFTTRLGRRAVHILATILLINFVRSAWQELREVKWPNRKQTTQLTLAVFIFALIFGAIISVADYGLDKVFKAVLLR